MTATTTGRLPRILIIDDQFGRCGLGSEFRRSVTNEVFAGYEADRHNLCANYGLIDITGDCAHVKRPNDPLAEAIFCPAQVWNHASKRIEPSADVALRMARRGWPFDDGSRWALILLDLRFVHGSLNTFGDPQEGSLFGRDVLLLELRTTFGEDLPIAVLSSTRKDENNALVRRLGALDFIQRVPGAGPPPQQARDTLRHVLFQHGLLEDSTGLVSGQSLSILKTLRQARRGSAAARNILLLGETGTGKGLLAQYIHLTSGRRDFAYEVFHAAHRPADLQADEMFGHWKGAFTGAVADAPGIWERADRGTLFIDEVAAIDLKVQEMLMQPIEERHVRRLGTPASGMPPLKTVDVLVLLATNQNLSAKGPGGVKLDFLNRINAFVIDLPPLRDRADDIPNLVAYLARKVAPTWKGQFLPDAVQALRLAEWREGNVRELRNVIERAIVNNPDQDITVRDLGLQHVSIPGSLSEEPDDKTWRRFAEALNRSPGNLSLDDAAALKIELRGLFLDLLVHVIEWSIAVTQEGDSPNLTACARFLLGRNDVSTMEAKQFFKKVLSLDTRGKNVARRLQNSPRLLRHETLVKLLKQIVKTSP